MSDYKELVRIRASLPRSKGCENACSCQRQLVSTLLLALCFVCDRNGASATYLLRLHWSLPECTCRDVQEWSDGGIFIVLASNLVISSVLLVVFSISQKRPQNKPFYQVSDLTLSTLFAAAAIICILLGPGDFEICSYLC
jgi:hypothetical protein